MTLSVVQEGFLFSDHTIGCIVSIPLARLIQISMYIHFHFLSTKGSGFIEASEFLTAYKSVFPTSSPEDAARVFSHFSHGSPVDYVSWCQHLSLKQMPTMAESIHKAYGDRAEMKGWLGDLSAVCLTIEEYQLLLSLQQRLDKIIQRVNLHFFDLLLYMTSFGSKSDDLCH